MWCAGTRVILISLIYCTIILIRFYFLLCFNFHLNVLVIFFLSFYYFLNVYIILIYSKILYIFTFILWPFKYRFMQLLCPYVKWVKSSFSITGVDSPLAFHHLPSLSFSQITGLKPVSPCHCLTWFLLATFYFQLLVHFSVLYDVMSYVCEIRAAWSACVRVHSWEACDGWTAGSD